MPTSFPHSRSEFDEFGKSYFYLYALLFSSLTPSFFIDRHPTPPSESDFVNTRLGRAPSPRCTIRRRPSRRDKDNAGSDDAGAEYRAALAATMTYAVERLNQRGVYANVVGFCAKVFGE